MRYFLILLVTLFSIVESATSAAQHSALQTFCKQLNLLTCPSNLLIKNDLFVSAPASSLTPRYVEFAEKINFLAMAELLNRINIGELDKRSAIQQFANNLNQQSVNNYINILKKSGKNIPTAVEYVAVNNAALFHFTPNKNTNVISNKNTFASKKIEPLDQLNEMAFKTPVIGLIDSGVSLKNDSMSALKISQFYPATEQRILVDTGLGHGTGIISLTEQMRQNQNIETLNYLSCVGLPHGKYQYVDIIKCLNWFFLQPRVDIILNPWLASEPGCLNQLDYPFQMIWLAGTIPIFSAGNYGESAQQNYSPANLSPFLPAVKTISVGAVDSKNQRLSSSSFKPINCGESRSIATTTALGAGYKVAVPFTSSSQQYVEGTSYAIVPVAIKALILKKENTHFSNQMLVKELLRSQQ